MTLRLIGNINEGTDIGNLKKVGNISGKPSDIGGLKLVGNINNMPDFFKRQEEEERKKLLQKAHEERARALSDEQDERESLKGLLKETFKPSNLASAAGDLFSGAKDIVTSPLESADKAADFLTFGARNLLRDATQATHYQLFGKKNIENLNKEAAEKKKEFSDLIVGRDDLSNEEKLKLIRSLNESSKLIKAGDIYDFANKTKGQIAGESIGALADFLTFGTASLGLKTALSKGGVKELLKFLGSKAGTKHLAEQSISGAAQFGLGSLGEGLQEKEDGKELADRIISGAKTGAIAQPLFEVGGASIGNLFRKSIVNTKFNKLKKLAKEKLGKLTDEESLFAKDLLAKKTDEEAIIKEIQSERDYLSDVESEIKVEGKATDASKLTDGISKAQSEDKSFDEFMETAIPKGENIFYHGTSASGAKNIDKVGFIKTKGGFNKGRGISVSSDVSVSDAFASGEVVGKSKGKEGSIFAVELKPNAKKIDAQEFLDIRNDLAKNMDLSWEEMTSSAKKMGYISAEQLSPAEITKLKFNKAGDDVYKLLEKQGVDMIDHSKRAYTVGAQQSESVILNPDAILSKTKLKTRSQLKQLWEGGKKTKGLAESVEAKAIKEDVAKTLGELPEYEVRGVKSKVNEAFDLVDKDKAKAIRIAMGEEKPPVGFIPEDFYVALVKKASSEGDAELLKMLATQSNLIDEATLMGQRIRTLGEIDPYSPVNKIKEVNKANSDRLGNIKKKVDKEVKDIKRKTKATVEDWSSFVNSIKC